MMIFNNNQQFQTMEKSEHIQPITTELFSFTLKEKIKIILNMQQKLIRCSIFTLNNHRYDYVLERDVCNSIIEAQQNDASTLFDIYSIVTERSAFNYFLNVKIILSQDQTIEKVTVDILNVQFKQIGKFQQNNSLKTGWEILSPISQRGIIAISIIKYIAQIKVNQFYDNCFTSIRERLVKDIIEKFSGKITNSIIKQMIQMFTDGIDLNPYYYSLSRHQIAEGKYGLITFCPTYVTHEIFKTILSQKKMEKWIIFGNSGSGKTFTFCLLSILSKMIQQYRFQIQKTKLNSEDFYCKQIEKIPRYYYISAKTKNNDQNFIQSLQAQFYPKKKEFFNKQNANSSITGILQQMYTFYRDKERRKDPMPIFLFDQINIYHSMIRSISQSISRSSKKEQQQLSFEEINQAYSLSQILRNIKMGFNIIYSSSINIQQNQIGLGSHIRRLLAIFQPSLKQYTISRYNDCKSYCGFLQTLNLIRFELNKRFQDDVELKHKYQSKRQKFMSQILIKDQIIRQIQGKQFQFIPTITNLNIAQYFTDTENVIKFMNSQKQYINIQNLTSYFIQLKQFSLSQMKKLFGNFFKSGTYYFRSLKIIFLSRIRENIITNKFKKIFSNWKSTKYILDKDLFNKNALQDEKQKYILGLNREYFRYDRLQDTIFFYQNPLNLLQIIQDIFFNFESEIDVVLMDFFQNNFKQNGTYCGELIDKCFARAISQCQFTFQIKNSIYIIKNSLRVKRFFRHFLNPAQLKEGKHDNYYVQKYFGKLLDSQEIKQLGEYQYIGVAPQIKAHYQDPLSTVISTNSPSFDMLLVKKIAQSRYKLLTFDFTVGLLTEQKIKERLQKLTKVRAFLAGISNYSKQSYELINQHIFLCKQQTKNDIMRYLKNNHCKGVSAQAIEDIILLTQNSKNPSSMLGFKTALKFVQNELKKN